MINNVEIITKLHRKTKRDYISRMTDQKVHCMKIAQKYSKEYWDGDRRYGYGGYSYDGRWKAVAQDLIKRYGLTSESRVLDLGCGMGHLLFELKKELGCEIVGYDISKYAKEKSPVSDAIELVDLNDESWEIDGSFDLIFSIMSLHNFGLKNLSDIFKKIKGRANYFYFAVESFRNDEELFNLQCWALTCKSFLSPDDWKYLVEGHSLSCDIEFLYFE